MRGTYVLNQELKNEISENTLCPGYYCNLAYLIAVKFKPLGDGFIKLVKMLISPIIFCTIINGIAGMQDTRKLGRVGLKAIIYFEVVTTFALIIGLVVINFLKPGVGMNIDPATLDAKSAETLINMIPVHGRILFCT